MQGLPNEELRDFLNEKVAIYNRPDFIADDPVSIPHRYTKRQDIEIAGFWAAILAWGQRKHIINKCLELFAMMDDAPYDFIMHHQEDDLKKLLSFKHRTFNATDTLYFITFFRNYFSHHTSLEEAFVRGLGPEDATTERGLIGFHNLFFGLPEAPARTSKHIATPARKSACKRINMFLRWMVRPAFTPP